MAKLDNQTPSRGPIDHEVRDQILATAGEHLALYGYAKTTVADVARELGFSKTYVYRFFESKQSIGDAIIAAHLSALIEFARAEVGLGASASEKFRRFFQTIVKMTMRLLDEDKKIYEIAVIACEEDWPSASAYIAELQVIIAEIVELGRQSGEFEKRTPLDEVTRTIFFAMTPFIEPTQMHRNRKHLPSVQGEMASMILRSLMP